MRRGEIVALKWEDVDFENQTISINKSMEQVRTNIREKETKSTRTRNVAVSSTIIEELRKHRAAQAEEQLRLGIRLTAKSYVYSQIDGRPLKPQSVTHEWTRLLEKTDLPRIRFHDLRHSHATQMLAVGIHPKIASERLGHSSIAITMDMYSHVMPGMQANAAEQVEEAIKRAQKSSK